MVVMPEKTQVVWESEGGEQAVSLVIFPSPTSRARAPFLRAPFTVPSRC